MTHPFSRRCSLFVAVVLVLHLVWSPLVRAESIEQLANRADALTAREKRDTEALARAMDDLAVYKLVVAIYHLIQSSGNQQSGNSTRRQPAPRPPAQNGTQSPSMDELRRIESGQ